MAALLTHSGRMLTTGTITLHQIAKARDAVRQLLDLLEGAEHGAVLGGQHVTEADLSHFACVVVTAVTAIELDDDEGLDEL